jgi:formylglycine-generating enzyme required for sulfatase activity
MGQPLLVSATPLIAVPAGTYVVSDPASSDGRFRNVAIAAYAIERHEVTNRDYRRCWEEGGCPSPSSFDSQSRPGYFANRSFDDFPVVNVSWDAANTYCAWVGRRLPTLEEWEVAASLAPATGLRYRYPWGERFDPRMANSALSELQDTQSIGAYHPAGSTPLGMMDLAGNVAEWTAMPASSVVDGGVVKGGSFRDPPEQLRNDAFVELPRSTSVPWLGFRCAAND